MSNIYTSYIRIIRRDRLDLNKDEIEKLFKLAVRSYDEFGSFWVRILKKYREPEKCLDIQFGSGKRHHSGNLLEDYEIFGKYHVWERFSDEGGRSDTIFTLEENSQNNYIETSEPVICLYRFNKVKITGNNLSEYFRQYHPEQLTPTEFEIKISGDYHACNSRSFVDLDENSKYYGPSLGYDPFYENDYNILTNDGMVTESTSELVNDVFVTNKELTLNTKVGLYWNNRLVQLVENIQGEILNSSADYWDNCGNQEYLNFIKS